MLDNANLNCKVAFIGAGAMAREHIRAFGDVRGVTLAGITNRTEAKAGALAMEFGLPVVAPDIPALYDATRADIVQVSVYETAIQAVMDQVLSFPWMVLMEKPVGLNASEAEAIWEAAEKRSRQVFVGLNRRALSSTRTVLADLEGDPGQRFIQIQDQQSLESAAAIGHHPLVLRNWMYANSIHLIDYLNIFGRGRITSVEKVHAWNPDHPTIVLAKATFSSGDIGLYQAIWGGPGPWACSVTTARRRWELRPLERASYVDSDSRTFVSVDPEPEDLTFKPGFRRQAEWAIAEWRKITTPLAKLGDGLSVMKLIRDIYSY
jgi:predicted dehydrogenase